MANTFKFIKNLTQNLSTFPREQISKRYFKFGNNFYITASGKDRTYRNRENGVLRNKF